MWCGWWSVCVVRLVVACLRLSWAYGDCAVLCAIEKREEPHNGILGMTDIWYRMRTLHVNPQAHTLPGGAQWTARGAFLYGS